jgi:transcriptional regulator with PAS, ATPase and Fis domain
MTELLSVAGRAAKGPAKVLITGESGVGKDVLARFIHTQSARKAAPFVAVNCAGLTETLLESELFGHVKGSFTGAYRDKRGKIQLANHGTLFLDEVGEMSLRMQALLLRFLENGEIQAVGSDQPQARSGGDQPQSRGSRDRRTVPRRPAVSPPGHPSARAPTA